MIATLGAISFFGAVEVEVGSAALGFSLDWACFVGAGSSSAAFCVGYQLLTSGAEGACIPEILN